jgi:hypothetical protein
MVMRMFRDFRRGVRWKSKGQFVDRVNKEEGTIVDEVVHGEMDHQEQRNKGPRQESEVNQGRK